MYTALLGAVAAVGDAPLAQQLYTSMAGRGVPPNQVVYGNCSMSSCCAEV